MFKIRQIIVFYRSGNQLQAGSNLIEVFLYLLYGCRKDFYQVIKPQTTDKGKKKEVENEKIKIKKTYCQKSCL